MNHTYRVIYNESTNTFVAVSEIVNAKGKKSKGKKSANSASSAVMAVGMAVAGTAGLAGLPMEAEAAVTIGGNNNGYAVNTGVSGTGVDATTVGTNARSGVNATVIGQNANGSTVNSVVVGSGATAGTFNNSVVVGTNASAGERGNADDGVYHAHYSNPYNSLTNNVVNDQGVRPTTAYTGGVDGGYIYSSTVAVGYNAKGGMGGVAIGSDATVTSSANEGGEARALGIAIGANAVSAGGGVVMGASASTSGVNAIAIGRQATATNASAQAYGAASAAVGKGAFAMGQSATALGQRSIAIGMSSSDEQYDVANRVVAAGANSIAFGSHARAGVLTTEVNTGVTGSVDVQNDNIQRASAFGYYSNATATDSMAFGSNATATETNATAFGAYSKANGTASVSVGSNASSAGNWDVVIGSNASTSLRDGQDREDNAYGYSASVAIGQKARSTGTLGDVIVGAYSTNHRITDRSISQSTILGSRSAVGGDQATAIGADVRAYGNSSLAIGGDDVRQAHQKLTAAGVTKFDGINLTAPVADGGAGIAAGHVPFFQSYAQDMGGAYVYDKSDAAIDGVNMPTSSIGDASIAMGPLALSVGTASTAIGVNAISKGEVSQAFGVASRAYGLRSNAMGVHAEAHGEDTIAIGTGAVANGTQAISIGTGNKVTGNHSGAIGDPTTVSGDSSYSLGNNNTVSASNAFVVGNNVTSSKNNSVILGDNSSETGSHAAATVTSGIVNGITYGGYAGAVSTDGHFVSVGAQGTERQIKNVAAGHIAEDSTDAINGSQLYLTQQALGNVANSTATHLGGDSKVNPDGTISAPTYNVVNRNGATVTDVGAPANNVGDAITAINNYINKGFGVQDQTGTNKTVVAPGDAIQFVDGNNTKANVTVVDGKAQITFDVELPTGTVDTQASVTSADQSITIDSSKQNDNGSTIYDLKVNTDGTTITTNTNGSIGVANTTLPVTAGSPVQAPSADNATKFVNAGDLAETLNNLGFNVQAGQTGTGTASGNENPAVVKVGDTVKFIAGDNVDIAQDGQNFTISAKANDANVANTTLTVGNDGKVAPQDPAGDGDKLVNASTVTDAINNSGFNVVANGEAPATDGSSLVKAGDTLNFVNGTGTTATVTKDGVSFNVNTTTFGNPDTTANGVNPNGTVATPVNGDSFVNASTLANTINNVSHNITIGRDDTDITDQDGKSDAQVKAGDTITLKAGKNLVAKQEGTNITFATADDVSFNSVTANSISVPTTPNDGATAGNPVTINNNGISAGDKPITNVASTVPTFTDGKPKDLLDLANVSTGDVNNAATVADLQKMGFVVSSDKTTGTGVGATDATEFVNQVKNADEVRFTGTGAAKVSGKVVDGVSTINVHVDSAQVDSGTVTPNNDGTVTGAPSTTGGTTATVGDVANAINNSGFNVVANGNTPAENGDDLVKAGDTLNFVNGTGTTANVTTSADGKITNVSYDSPMAYVNADQNDTSTPSDTVKLVGDNPVQVQNVASGVRDDVTITNPAQPTPADKKALADAINNATGDTLNNAVNVGDLQAAAAAAKTEVTSENKTIDVTHTVGDNGQSIYNVEVNTTNITVGNNGKVDAPVTGDGDKVVNAGDIVDAINNSGWVTNATDAQGNSVPTVVNAGTQVDFVNGTGTTANVKVDDNGNITVSYNSPMAYVGTDGNITDAAGNPNGPTNTVTLVGEPNSTAPVSVTNVAGNLEPTYNTGDYNIVDGKPSDTTAAAPTKAQDKPTPDQVKDMYNNVATVGDVLNAGFNLKENGADKDFVKAYDTVNFVNGTGTIANVTVSEDGTSANVKYDIKVDGTTITVDPDGNLRANNNVLVKGGTGASVNTTTDSNGTTVYTVSATGVDAPTTNLTTNPNGTVAVPVDGNSTDFVNAGDIVDAINNSGWVTNATDAQGNSVPAVVNAGTQVDFVNGTGTTANVKVDDNGNITVSYNSPMAYVGTDGNITDAAGNPNGPTNTVTLVGEPNSTAPVSVTNVAGNLEPTYNTGDYNIVDGKPSDTTAAAPTKAQDKPTPDQVKDMYNNVATVGDVLNAGFNLKENGADKDFVKAYDTVNFVNGTGTIANVTVSEDGTSANVKYDIKVDGTTITVDPDGNLRANNNVLVKGGTGASVNTTTDSNGTTVYTVSATGVDAPTTNLTTNPNGTVAVPVDGNSTDFVNAGDIVDAINNSGWVTNATDAQGNSVPTVVNAGTQVDFVNGTGTTANVKVDDNGNITVSYNSPMAYVGTDGNITDAAGNPNGPTNTVTLVGEPNSTAPVSVTNVAGNLEPTYNTGDYNIVDGKPSDTTAAAPTKAQDKPTPDQVKDMYNNVATVGDVLNAGFNLKENGADKDFVKAYDTVNFVNGTGTIANVTVSEDGTSANVKYDIKVDGTTITVDPDGNLRANNNVLVKGGTGASVNTTTDSNGTTVYTVSATGVDAPTTNLTTNPNGTVAVPVDGNSTDFVNAGDIVDAINNSGWVTNATDAQGNSVPTVVNAGTQVDFVNGTGTTANVKVDDNGNITVSYNSPMAYVGTDGNITDAAGNPNGPTNTVTLVGEPNSTAPVSVTNVAGNLEPTYNTGDYNIVDGKPSDTTAAAPTKAQDKPTPDQVKDMYNNVATVGDVLNAGFNLKENGADKDFVKAYDTVNFVNGTGTIANVTVSEDGTSANVKYDIKVDGTTITVDPDGNLRANNNVLVKGGTGASVNTTTDSNGTTVYTVSATGVDAPTTNLTTNPNGTVAVPVDGNSTDFVNAGDIVDAINNSGWVTNATDAQGNSVPTVVNAGTQVDFVNGTGTTANVKVDDNGNITVSYNSPMAYVGTDGNITDAAGNPNGPTNTVTLVGEPNSTAPVSVTNVAGNLEPTYNTGDYNIVDGKPSDTTAAAPTKAQDKPTPDQVKDMYNNVATVGDVLNAGFNLKENGADKDFVKAYDTVNFVNGTGTIANVTVSEDGTSANVKYDIKVDGTTITVDPDGNLRANNNVLVKGGTGASVNTTTDSNGTTVYTVSATGVDAPTTNLTTNPNGTVAVPVDGNSTDFVNAGDIVDAINNSGWVTNATDAQGNSVPTVVNAGTQVDFVNGTGTTANVKVDDNGNITVSYNSPMAYVGTDGNITDAAGNPNGPTNTVTLVGEPNSTAPVSVTNVAGNLEPTYNTGDYNIVDGKPSDTTAAAPTKAQDKPTPDQVKDMYNNVATVGDVLNAGFNLKENGADKDFVKAYDTVNFVNGTGTIANVTVSEDGTSANVKYDIKVDGTTITVDPDGNLRANNNVLVKGGTGASVNTTTDSNGTTVYTVSATGVDAPTTNLTTNPNGTVAVPVDGNSTDFVNAGDIVDAINNSGWVTNATDAQGNSVPTVVNAGTQVDFVNGTGTTANVKVDDNGNITVSYNSPMAYVGTDGNITDAAGNPNGPTNTVTLVGEPNSTAPVSVTNVAGNLEPTYNTGDYNIVDGKPSDTTAAAPTKAQDKPTPDQVKDMYNNVATVGDVLNAGFNLKENGADKDFVKAYDTVNFVNGTGTIANVTVSEDGTSANVKYDIKVDGTTITVDPDGNLRANNNVLVKGGTGASVNTTTDSNGTTVYTVSATGVDAPTTNLTTNPNGTVAVPVDGNSTDFVNAGDIVDAINNSGWVTNATDAQGNSVPTVVNAGTQVDFVNGTGTTANVKVDDNGNITVSYNSPMAYVGTDGNITDAAGNPNGPTNTVTLVGEPNSTAPVSVTNVAGNLEPTYNTGDYNIVDGKPSDTTAAAPTKAQDKPTPDQVKDMYNNVATVGDVLNAGFNLKENGADKDFVKAYDTVNFVNGTGTIANVTVSEDGTLANVKYDIKVDGTTITVDPDGNLRANNNVLVKGGTGASVNTTTDSNGTTVYTVSATGVDAPTTNLTTNPNGTVAVPVDGNSTDFVNAGDIVDAINNSGWVTNATDAQGNSVPTVVNAGTQVDFVNGTGTTANVKVDDNGNITVSYNSPMAYVGTDGNITDAAGNPNGPTNTVTLVGGDKNAPVTLTGATSGLAPTVVNTLPNVTAPAVPANVIDFNAPNNANIADSTVATVGDLRNMGFVVSTSGSGYNDVVRSGDTVDFVGADGITVTGTTVDGKRVITIAGTGMGTGNVTTGTIGPDDHGGVVSNSTTGNLADVDDVKKAIMHSGWIAQVNGENPVGTEEGKEDIVTPKDKVNFVSGGGVNVTAVVTSVDVLNDDGSVTRENTTTYSFDMPIAYIDNNSEEVYDKDHTNVVRLRGKNPDDNVLMTKMDSGVSNVLGPNTHDTRSKDDVANAIESAAGDTRYNSANIGDVQAVQHNLKNYIADVHDDANAGTSSAMATAALPQAYLPGKSMITGGVASYNGEGAVAIGMSKLSDNGRWVLKVSGSADTQGNVGGAVGAGFHF